MRFTKNKTDLERFELHFIPEPNTGCWLWSSTIQKQGYGNFWKDGTNRRAHRVSFELYKGQIPKGLLVCHTCDMRSCVNPDHLFLGTAKDNVDDMIKKGRKSKNSGHPGESSWSAKLTESDIISIRKMRQIGVKTKAISILYGVTQRQIQSIIAYKRWKHI